MDFEPKMFGLYMIMCLFYFLDPKHKNTKKNKEKQHNNIQENGGQ